MSLTRNVREDIPAWQKSEDLPMLWFFRPRGIGFERRHHAMIALKRLATGIVAIFCMTAVAAQDSLRTHTIEDVVVTANKSRTSNVFSTIPVQSFSGDDIRLMGLQNIADAVKKFAGTSVKDYGGIGGMKTVSVRNLGAQHTAVSYDGIVVSNTQAGQIDIGRLSLDNVENLSMAISQGNDLMQSARHYASAALMSIETEKPNLGKGEHLIRLGLATGSWGQVNPHLRLWKGLGNNTTLSIDADWMRADGYYPYTLTNGLEQTRVKRQNSDIVQWHLEGNLLVNFSDSSRIDTKVYFYRSERGLPGSVILYNDNAKERLWDENLFVQSIYTKVWSNLWKMKVRAKYTHSWNKYEDYNVKYSDGVLTDINRQDEYYASATIGWSPMKWLQLSVSEDIAFNKLNTTVNGNPDPLRFTSLTSLAVRLKAGRLTADANLVATYATESLTESEKYSIKTPDDRHKLSPSLALSYRLLHDHALYLRANVKSTFRMPTFNDLYYLQIGNTALRPEKAQEYGGGITWNSGTIGHLKYLAITADGYYNHVTDKIVAFPSTYVWKMVNFGKVDIIGVDVTAAMEVELARKWSVAATGAFTLQDAKDKTVGSGSYNHQLPYTPKSSGSASLSLLNPWINIYYSMTWQGKRYSQAETSYKYLLNPYSEHTLSMSKTFLLRGDKKISLQFTINNIFDKQYEIIKYYPMPGRSITATAIVEFGK